MTRQNNNPSIPRWGRLELTLTSSAVYTNPIQETTLQVTFIAPSGQEQTLWGFWDGGATWRVRFKPDEPGRWQYTTRCSDPANTGLHHQSGTFTCGDPAGPTSFNQHGPLRLSDNRRYLVHADGTPFFWLADTAWNGPLRATPEEWAYYLQERLRQKFTAVQWVATQWISAPEGDLAGELPFTGYERITVNPTAFQRLDNKLEAINQAGLLAVPVLLWAAEWGNPDIFAVNPGLTLPEAQAIRLARYMVARWGAHDVAWILPGDGIYTGPKAERWRRIGRGVFGDIPHAPVTLHPSGMQWCWPEFREEGWLDIAGYQSCHFGDDEALTWLVSGPPATAWQNEPVRPVINLEPNYENIIDIRNHDRRFTAEDVRRAMYWSLLVSPTAGVTYGGHGVWGWDDGTAPPIAHDGTGIPLPWQEALHMPAAEQIAHLADLFHSIPWWRLQPAPELLAAQPGQEDPGRHIAAATTETRDLALVYIPLDRRVSLNLAGWQPLSAQWVNPRTGERSPATPAIEGSLWYLETPGRGDWVLLLSV